MSRIADLAGLLRAMQQLQPADDGARSLIARQFGITLVRDTPSEERPAARRNPPPAPLKRSFSDAQEPKEKRQRPEPRPTEVEVLGEQRAAPPAWLGDRTLPVAPVPGDARSKADVRPTGEQPCLLPIGSRRTILLELAGSLEARGALEVGRLVQEVARGRIVHRLPRRRIRRLPPRIVLLLDEGPGMDPFAADQLHLADALRRVAGAERVQASCFSDRITDGLRDPLTGCGAQLPAGAEDVLVVLSDLGIARQYPAAGIAELDDLCAEGRRIVVLNPFPPERWPACAPGGPVVLHWHEGLRVGDVRRAKMRRAGVSHRPGAQVSGDPA